MKKFSINFKILVLMIILAVFGIVSSAFMIDNYYKEQNRLEVKNNIDVVVNVYNNSDKVDVDIVEKDNGEVDVTISDKKLETTEHDYKDTSSYYPIQGIINTERGLNIRQDADINSDKVGVYEYGETVEIIDVVEDWYITDEGFIYKEYVLLI